MRTQAQQETARQQRRLAKLTDERTKLLHAYYQGAIPIDLLHQEHRHRNRRHRSTAHARRALHNRRANHTRQDTRPTRRLPNAYAKAPAHLRRQWNQAFFLRLHVHDQDIRHADIAEPFATLTAPSLPHALNSHQPRGSRRTTRRNAHPTTASSNGHGSNKTQTVGAPGFEPGYSPCRSRLHRRDW
jgi:hypothetical protein